MRPITVITAIILGSCFAITLCLIAVWILLTLVSGDPEMVDRVANELTRLPGHIAIFMPLTLVSALAFITSQKRVKAWWAWQILQWFALVLVGFYYFSTLTGN